MLIQCNHNNYASRIIVASFNLLSLTGQKSTSKQSISYIWYTFDQVQATVPKDTMHPTIAKCLTYTILYYTILYYTILYYTILYYTILYYRYALHATVKATVLQDHN